MVIISPRIQFFEINDQPWFPSYLREKVQSCLAIFWNFRVPLIQKTSPAHLVARTLYKTLGENVTQYQYLDFCAGAGGPTPAIERALNKRILISSNLHPHIQNWTIAAKRSEYLSFISESVDATDAPTELNGNNNQKTFRLYNLAFHHFDNKMASDVLRDTLEKSNGFGIFELQHRTLSSMITIVGIGILLLIISPFYFWRSPGHLFFTYIIPIIPFVVVFDGFVSSLRTRTTEEISALINGCGVSSERWGIFGGEEQHTWPVGNMTWVIGIKRNSAH